MIFPTFSTLSASAYSQELILNKTGFTFLGQYIPIFFVVLPLHTQSSVVVVRVGVLQFIDDFLNGDKITMFSLRIVLD